MLHLWRLFIQVSFSSFLLFLCFRKPVYFFSATIQNFFCTSFIFCQLMVKHQCSLCHICLIKHDPNCFFFLFMSFYSDFIASLAPLNTSSQPDLTVGPASSWMDVSAAGRTLEACAYFHLKEDDGIVS